MQFKIATSILVYFAITLATINEKSIGHFSKGFTLAAFSSIHKYLNERQINAHRGSFMIEKVTSAMYPGNGPGYLCSVMTQTILHKIDERIYMSARHE
jgi:hypothetical protein